jgi:hypothetical protein
MYLVGELLEGDEEEGKKKERREKCEDNLSSVRWIVRMLNEKQWRVNPGSNHQRTRRSQNPCPRLVERFSRAEYEQLEGQTKSEAIKTEGPPLDRNCRANQSIDNMNVTESNNDDD